MSFKKPCALKKGDTISIVASSSPFEKAPFLKGVSLLNSWGFKTKYHKNIFQKTPYLAGSDKRRSSELISALNDPTTKAVLFARGGYGAMRILPFLEKAKLKNHPKIILGYSDITALLIYIQKRLGWVNFYGPVVAKDICKDSNQTTLSSLKENLTSTTCLPSLKFNHVMALKKGKVTAPITGGCLSLISALSGTKFDIKTDNKILLLEDVNEKPYEIDRLLTQLKLAGKFNKCLGVVFGSMAGPNPKKHYIETIKGIFSEYKFPVLFDFPIGHSKTKITIPLGVKVCLDTKTKSLTFLEPALK